MRRLVVALCLAMMPLSAWAATSFVNQANKAFDTETVTIKTGDSIVFTNQDDVTHNIQITNDKGDISDRGLQKPGQNITATFDTPGEYRVRCAIHSKMKATVIVQ